MVYLIYLFLGLLAAYLFIGLIFALIFLNRGIEKMDPGAKNTRWGFKMAIFPGVVLLWVVLLQKWIKLKS